MIISHRDINENVNMRQIRRRSKIMSKRYFTNVSKKPQIEHDTKQSYAILSSKENGNTIRLINKENGKVIEDERLPDHIKTNFFY